MIKAYEIICLDKAGKPLPVATIEANGEKKARQAGLNLAHTLRLRFHLAKRITNKNKQ
jgi:hypothetical protein